MVLQIIKIELIKKPKQATSMAHGYSIALVETRGCAIELLTCDSMGCDEDPTKDCGDLFLPATMRVTYGVPENFSFSYLSRFGHGA